MTTLGSPGFFLTIGILGIPLTPLGLGLCFLNTKWKTWAISLSPWVALFPLLTVAFTPTETYIDLPWLWAGGSLGLDASTKPFLFFTSLVWFLGGIFSLKYLESDEKKPAFFLCYLLALAGNLGLIVAQDFIGFKTFFSLMSFASYGLIVQNADPDSLKSGKIYMVMTLLGEVVLFAAMVWLYHLSGSLNFKADTIADLPNSVQILLLLGFGIKAGIFPLHFWLPLAHTHAPAPASAILSGVMIKAGLLGWLRFFPIGEIVYPEIGMVSIVLGFFTAFYGIFAGIFQDNSKTVLAYSSICQMGLMLTALGIGWSYKEIQVDILDVILFYAFHHAFTKSALFFGFCMAMGNVAVSTQRFRTMMGVAIPALSLAGFIFTSGSLAKTGVKMQIHFLSNSQQEIIIGFLSLSSIGTTILMFKFAQILWKKEWPKVLDRINNLQIIWAAILIYVFLIPWLYPLKAMQMDQFLFLKGMWNSVWPVGIGVLIGLLGMREGRKRGTLFSGKIPPGDIIVLLENLYVFLTDAIKRCIEIANRLNQSICSLLLFGKNNLGIKKYGLMALEKLLGSWTVFGSLFVFLILVLLLSTA